MTQQETTLEYFINPDEMMQIQDLAHDLWEQEAERKFTSFHPDLYEEQKAIVENMRSNSFIRNLRENYRLFSKATRVSMFLICCMMSKKDMFPKINVFECDILKTQGNRHEVISYNPKKMQFPEKDCILKKFITDYNFTYSNTKTPNSNFKNRYFGMLFCYSNQVDDVINRLTFEANQHVLYCSKISRTKPDKNWSVL